MSGGRLPSGKVEFAFIAALEREVRGAISGWSRSTLRIAGAEQRIYRSEPQRAVLVCAGTGRERAYDAARACVEKFSPRVLISVGFAGACVPELAPGAVVIPARLVVAATAQLGGGYAAKNAAPAAGARQYECAFGSGTLVSLDAVAGTVAKRQARERFGALAVEMEAAGVAAAAAECGTGFAAIKAISDEVDEEMDFLSPFVTPEGFATARFLAYVAARPRLWPRVAALQRNSKLAAAALARALGECCTHGQVFAARHD